MPKIVIQQYERTAQYFIEDLGNGIQLEMMLIPGDTFIMGSPEKEEGSTDYERPQHTVTIKPFFMGRYLVTQEQWKAVAALPWAKKGLDPDPSLFKVSQRPVEQVSWIDAVEFCDRLSQYTGKNYRLPSEAEWEYACRAGTTTPFHFGKTITSELANYDATETYGAGVKGTYRDETTEVGSFGVANNFGLYDMHGNVWEWCLDDWHDNYEGAPTDGSAWIDFENNNNANWILRDNNAKQILRGGSWYSDPAKCRSAYRSNYQLHLDNKNNGFRVVCDLAMISLSNRD